MTTTVVVLLIYASIIMAQHSFAVPESLIELTLKAVLCDVKVLMRSSLGTSYTRVGGFGER